MPRLKSSLKIVRVNLGPAQLLSYRSNKPLVNFQMLSFKMPKMIDIVNVTRF